MVQVVMLVLRDRKDQKDQQVNLARQDQLVIEEHLEHQEPQATLEIKVLLDQLVLLVLKEPQELQELLAKLEQLVYQGQPDLLGSQVLREIRAQVDRKGFKATKDQLETLELQDLQDLKVNLEPMGSLDYQGLLAHPVTEDQLVLLVPLVM